MTSFEQYRLPSVPSHLDIPQECAPCIAGLLSARAVKDIASWPSNVRADDVLHGLQWHGIGPVLYRNASERGDLSSLPAWLQEFLKRTMLHTTAANMAIAAELLELDGAFQRAGIPFILLKGSALMRTAYPSIGLRPMLDVDLLVRESDLELARGLLSEAQYRPITSRKHFASEHHLQFVSTARRCKGLYLELHWRLSDQDALKDRLALKDLWNRSVPAPAPAVHARVFDLCDQVLHVALHIAEHYGLPQLRRVCDLHELSKLVAAGNHWRLLARRAVQCDLQLVLAASLQEAQHWFATDVAEEFWTELQSGLPASSAAQRAFDRCHEPALIELEIRELRSLRTLRGKISHVLSLLVPDARFMRHRHRVPAGGTLWPYYLLRLFNGARNGLKSVWPRHKGVVSLKQQDSAESTPRCRVHATPQ